MTTRFHVPLGIALAVALAGVSAGSAQNDAKERPAPKPARAKARAGRAEGSPIPTHANIAYGPHERNVLDFWQAKSDKPTPLAIFIHGGGFIGGSKEQISVGALRDLLDAGVSVAAINYRLISHAPLPAAHHDCARAVQFLRSKAEQWNLDKTRFAAFGGSAGAQLAMYLAFHDDLAEPKSDDPISRESTRLACVSPSAGQVTMDFDWWSRNVPGYDKPLRDPLEPFGAKTKVEALAKNKEIAALELISKDDPPVFMSYTMAPGQPYPDDSQAARNWKIHHVVHGVELKKLCDRLGVECDVKYPGANTRYASAVEFLRAKLLGGGASDAGNTPEAGVPQTVDPPEGAKPAVAADGPCFRLRRATCKLFEHWANYRDGTITRAALLRRMGPVRREVERLLLRGAESGNRGMQGMCRESYDYRDWLWTFLRHEGIEPTNNASERSLRHAVIWRKLSFGTQSVGGSRFVETMLTVIETCRQQRRNAFSFGVFSRICG